MPPRVFDTLEEFWDTISGAVEACNYPSYHPCCKVWTSRFQKSCRDSHGSKITWGSALSSVGYTGVDSKRFLKVHMLEQGWGTPIQFNFHCLVIQSKSALNRAVENRQNYPNLPPCTIDFCSGLPFKRVLSPLSTPVVDSGIAIPVPQGSNELIAPLQPPQQEHNHQNTEK